MDQKILDNSISEIQKKLDKEKSALISSDIATIQTANQKSLEEVKILKEQLEQSEKDKQAFLNENYKLMQAIGYKVENKKDDKKDDKKDFDFNSAFDKNGNFI